MDYIAIYIPIWLDLLYAAEMKEHNKKAIYIPIWLDLLYYFDLSQEHVFTDLHSNMVRFIM